jgi:hypothetical protein
MVPFIEQFDMVYYYILHLTFTITSDSTVMFSLPLLGSGLNRDCFRSFGLPKGPRPQLRAYNGNSSKLRNFSSSLTTSTNWSCL